MRRLHVTRRQVLEGTAGLWVAAALLPRAASAQGTSVLHTRSYSDIQDFDPAFNKAAPDGDVSRCVFRKLIDYKSGTSWEWELDAAAEIKQVDPKTVSFTLKPGIKWTGGFGDSAQGIIVFDPVFRELDAADFEPVRVDPDIAAVVEEAMQGLAGREIALDAALGPSGTQHRAPLRRRRLHGRQGRQGLVRGVRGPHRQQDG